MIIALHSDRARSRVEALLHRDLNWVAWRIPGPKAGYAEVSDDEYARIQHLPGVTKAQPPRRPRTQLPLL